LKHIALLNTCALNLVNKANLVHNLFLIFLFSVYLSISTSFGQLCGYHQEKQLYLCDTWYLLFCMDDCLVCRFEFCMDDCLVCRVEFCMDDCLVCRVEFCMDDCLVCRLEFCMDDWLVGRVEFCMDD